MSAEYHSFIAETANVTKAVRVAKGIATPVAEDTTVGETAGDDDDDDDNDGDGDGDAESVLSDTSVSSITSSVLEFQFENRRTYHGFHQGKYLLPCDEQEHDRLEINHQMFYIMLEDRMCLCPKHETGAKRVLDLGTGNGSWAVDFADRYPEAEVIGVDLSPPPQDMVPPNCSFQIDDLDLEWTWSRPFDFILGRCVASSFKDVSGIIDKSFRALEPGGYLELQDIFFPVDSDDGTLKADSPIFQWSRFLMLATEKLNRPITAMTNFKDVMESAGFEDVVEKYYKWPFNAWPRDPLPKKLGAFMKVQTEVGCESISMAWFTRVLGWTRAETINFCMSIRREIQDPRIHAYFPIYIVYGRKPFPKDKGKQREVVPKIKVRSPSS